MRPNKQQKLIIALSMFLFSIVTAVHAQTCGYEFSKLITIDHTQVSGTTYHSDFPVLVSLTDNDLRSTGNGGDVESVNGYDIAFLDEGSGELLAHEIESYTATTGALVAWVRVPKVYSGVNTEIRMVYGNDEVTSNPSTTQTWDTNYQAVWHLHNDFNDATSFGNNGTNNGSADATGFIADGQDFSNDWISRTDASLNGNIPAKSSGSPDEFTLSGWMRFDALNARRPLLSKQGDGAGNDRGFVLMMESTNDLKIEIFKDNISGNRTEVYSSATFSAATWYYITATYRYVTDGTSECSLYINGQNDGSTSTAVGPIFTNARDLEIGRYFWAGGTEYYQDGLIDEVRISDVVRSADWIATEYANQSSPSTFYTVGSEETGIYTPSVPTCSSEYKKIITIDNNDVAGTGSHSNFPVLISFTDNDLRTVANGGHVQNSNGWDIVFTDENLVSLSHDLEAYEPTTGELVAWVNVPSLPTGTDYDIHMFYGNPNVFSDPSSPCTWVDFNGVWHLHDDFLDATYNDEDGTNNGSTDNTTSQIADGQSFDGGDFIELSSFPNKTTDFTLSGWIRTTDNTVQGQRVFCDDASNTGGYALSLGDPGTGRIRFYWRSKSNVIVDGAAGTIANNTWYYVAGVADVTNQDRFIYVNGVQNAAYLTDAGTSGTDAGNASIGGETNAGETGNRFRGLLDEVRVASVARSANWLLTEYNNQSNPAGFYTVGSEESLSPTSVQNGDWDQTTTWSTGTVPSAGSNVVINHLVDIDDRDETICNLTISSAANVDSRLELENSHSMEITEDLNLVSDGTGDVDVTIRTNTTNSVLTIDGDLIITSTDGDDTFIDVQGAGDSIIVHGSIYFTHTGGDDADFLVDNATAGLLVDGNFFMDLQDGEDDIVTVNLNAGDFTVSGFTEVLRAGNFSNINFDLDGGDFTTDSLYISTTDGDNEDPVQITVDGTSVMTITNGVLIDMGGGDDCNIYVNENNGTSAQLNIGGDFIYNKTGGDDLNITVDDVNSEFNIGGRMVITSTGGEQITINMDNGAMTVGDSFIIHHFDGGQIVAVDLDGAANLTADNMLLDVDENASQDFFVTADQTAQINVTNDLIMTIVDGDDLGVELGQNVAASTAQLNVDGDVIMNHNTGGAGDDNRIIISESCTGTIGGELYMSSDGASSNYNFYAQLQDDAVLSVASDITMTGGDGFGEVMIWLNDNCTLQIGGNFVRDATPYGLVQSSDATTTIEYNGTGSQVFADENGAGGDGIQYELVVINNSFGTIPQLTMEDNVTLTNSITFIDGVLETTSSELLTLADGATASSGNANSYVSGPLMKIGDDPFVFPVGKGSTWARIEISDLQNGPLVTDEFTAEYFDAPHPESFWNPGAYAGNAGGLWNTSTLEYWELSRSGNAEPLVTLYWESNAASVIDDTTELTVAHYLGGNTWADEGGNASGVLAAGAVTTANHVSSFSPFTFGSTSGSANPLPIELLSLNAHLTDGIVKLNWVTTSEINNDYFLVQRSPDNQSFITLGKVNGAGHSNTEIYYEKLDENPLNGTSYYRLAQIDFDGSTVYSESVQIDISKGDNFLVYPNPVDDILHFSENTSGQIFDSKTQAVFSFNHETHLDLSSLSAGVYYLIVTGRSAIKVIVR